MSLVPDQYVSRVQVGQVAGEELLGFLDEEGVHQVIGRRLQLDEVRGPLQWFRHVQAVEATISSLSDVWKTKARLTLTLPTILRNPFATAGRAHAPL